MREGWQTKMLGELGKVITGSTPSTRDESNYSSPDVCFVKPSDIEKTGITTISNTEFHISRKAFQQSRKLPKGSVLTTCIGIIGKVGILGVDATCNQQINAIIPDKGVVSSSFLAYSILSRQHLLSSIANAPVVPIINKGEFSSVAILVPSIAEQEKIVAELDCMTGIIEKKKQQLEELDKLAQSIFYDMFGDPITNEKGWEVKSLSDVCSRITDGSHNPPKGVSSSCFRMISSQNITEEGIVYQNVRFLSKEDYLNENKRTSIRPGDVLLTIVGTIGRTCIVSPKDTSITLQRSVAVLRSELVSSVFLKSFLIAIRPQLEEEAHGVAQKGIYLKQLAKTPIIIPPRTLQNEFAKKMEAIEKQKELVKQSIVETETLFNSRMDYWFN